MDCPDLKVRRASPLVRRARRCFPDTGPVRLMLELKRFDGHQYRTIVPGWVIQCSGDAAVQHARLALQRLMADLHNVTLVPPDALDPPVV
jgi:hypothetical protein